MLLFGRFLYVPLEGGEEEKKTTQWTTCTDVDNFYCVLLS